MQHIKRLLLLLTSGFFVAAGVSLAIAIAILAFQSFSNKSNKVDPNNYQLPPSGEVLFSDTAALEITKQGGIRGTVTNNTKRKISSFRAKLEYYKKDQLLYTCNETVLVDVEPSKAAQFQLLCYDVERSALTPEMVPKLSLVWVYPSIDK
jgi:hypothetical protein